MTIDQHQQQQQKKNCKITPMAMMPTTTTTTTTASTRIQTSAMTFLRGGLLSLLSSILLLLVLLHPAQNVDAVHITVDNMEDVTDGKNVLMKFCIPTNDECFEFDNNSDVWNQLENDYDGHQVGLVGDVDCSSILQGRPLCEAFDVQTFPTFLVYYGDDPYAINVGEVYDNSLGIDYESLSTFADDKISKFRCTPLRIDACDSQEQVVIEELQSKSLDELNAIVSTVTNLVEQEETVFDERVTEIQKLYEQYVEEYNTKMDDIKTEYNYEYVEQIVAIKSVSSIEFDDDDNDHGGDGEQEEGEGGGGAEL